MGTHRPWMLGILLGLALGLRLGWAWHLPSDREALAALPDQLEYLALGDNLLHGRGLQFYDARFGQSVHAYRLPGYPAFVAALGASPKPIRIVQAIVDSLNVLAVWLLAGRMLGVRGNAPLPDSRGSLIPQNAPLPDSRGSLIPQNAPLPDSRGWFAPGMARVVAGACVAFNPYLIYLSGLILSESLFTALLLWALVLLAPAPRGWRWRWMAAMGLLIAAIYVRPSALLLPMVLMPVAVWMNRAATHPYQVGKVMLAPVVAGLLILMALSPWAYRNYRVLGQWVWTSTNGGITAYDGWNPGADGSSNQSFVAEMPQLRRMDELERSAYLQRLAGQYVRAHPWDAARLTLLKVGRTWSPFPLSAQYGSNWVYVLSGIGFTAPFFILVVAGLVGKTLPRSCKAALLLPAVYFTLVHAASVGSLRYRIPAEAPMAVIAGAALAQRRTGETRLSHG